jgi:hypothetical protein
MAGLIVFLVALFLVLGGAAVGFDLWLHGKGVAGRAELDAELATEPALLGPERGVYRGSTGSYSKVMGNGTIVLTARRVIFRKATGGRVDVSLADVSRIDQQKVFNRGVVGTRIHLVLHTSHGDVGYFVTDPDAWAAAVGTAVAAAK